MNTDTRPNYGPVIETIAVASGVCPQAVALALSSMLGGVAGEYAGIQGPMGELIRPATNLVVASADSPGWQRAMELLLGPIDVAQRRVRELSRAIAVDRFEAIKEARSQKDQTNWIVEQPENALFSAAGSIWAGVEQRKLEALRQPSYMLRNPTPKAFKSGINEVLDRAPLLVYSDGNLFNLSHRPSRESQEYLAAVTAAVAGCDDFDATTPGLGHLEAIRAKMFASCTKRQLQDALTGDNEATRLIQSCLCIDVEVEAPGVRVNDDWLRSGYAKYRDSVKEVVVARRSGQGMRFSAKPEEAVQLREFVNDLLGSVLGFPESLRPYFRGVLSLPYRVLWTLRATASNISGDELCRSAVDVCTWAVKRQHKLIETLLGAAAVDAHQRARQVMLAKLKGRPCTLRELVRRYPIQRIELHRPILMELVDDGLIRVNQGVLCLAENSTKEV